MHCSVSNSGRNGQLRFRARAWFAPEFYLSPDSFRAFADAQQSPVPLAGPLLQDLAIDVPSHYRGFAKPEELVIVHDFGLDAAGVCMEGVLRARFACHAEFPL